MTSTTTMEKFRKSFKIWAVQISSRFVKNRQAQLLAHQAVFCSEPHDFMFDLHDIAAFTLPKITVTAGPFHLHSGEYRCAAPRGHCPAEYQGHVRQTKHIVFSPGSC